MYSFVHSTVFIHYRPHSATLLQVLGPRMQCLFACKEADQMPTTRFPASASTVRLHLPACLAALWPCDWAPTSRTQARVTLRIPQPWSLENLPYESLTLSPSSVCQPEAEHPTGQSQQKKEETQNGYLEDLTPVTHMEVPFEGKKKKKGTPFLCKITEV